jgi:hypothetical protein
MPADPLRSLPKTKAAFVEPMDCLPVPRLPEVDDKLVAALRTAEMATAL